MSSQSYLGRLIRRTRADAPGLVPPRRFDRALPTVAMSGEPAQIDRPQAAEPSTAPAPPSVPPSPAEMTPAGPPIQPGPAGMMTGPIVPGRPLAGQADQVTDGAASAPGVDRATQVPPARRAARPAADFVFDTPRRAAQSIRPSVNESSAGAAARAGPLHDAEIRDAEPMRERATRRAAPPDPLAVALASAVRWTSAEAEPPARPARVSAPEPAAERSRPADIVPPPPALPPPPAPRPPPAPPSAHDSAAAGSPPLPLVSSREDELGRAGVHIGSIDVEIVAAPEAEPRATPPRADPAPARAASVLARKVESQFGLYQR